MTKFRPANGTEGEAFMEAFCFRCALDNFTPLRTRPKISSSQLASKPA